MVTKASQGTWSWTWLCQDGKIGLNQNTGISTLVTSIMKPLLKLVMSVAKASKLLPQKTLTLTVTLLIQDDP